MRQLRLPPVRFAGSGPVSSSLYPAVLDDRESFAKARDPRREKVDVRPIAAHLEHEHGYAMGRVPGLESKPRLWAAPSHRADHPELSDEEFQHHHLSLTGRPPADQPVSHPHAHRRADDVVEAGPILDHLRETHRADEHLEEMSFDPSDHERHVPRSYLGQIHRMFHGRMNQREFEKHHHGLTPHAHDLSPREQKKLSARRERAVRGDPSIDEGTRRRLEFERYRVKRTGMDDPLRRSLAAETHRAVRALEKAIAETRALWS